MQSHLMPYSCIPTPTDNCSPYMPPTSKTQSLVISKPLDPRYEFRLCHPVAQILCISFDSPYLQFLKLSGSESSASYFLYALEYGIFRRSANLENAQTWL
jgi:hypothetical protein